MPAPVTAWQVRAPYDGALLGEVQTTSAEMHAQALSEAQALHRDRRRRLPAGEPIDILRKAATLLEERLEHFALEAAREGGKPLTDSRIEAARAVDGLRCAAEVLRTEDGQGVPMRLNPASAQRVAFTTREPIGAVLA